MNKSEKIQELIGVFRRISQILSTFSIESWRKLDLPLAQLKSLFLIINKKGTNFRTLAGDLGVTQGNVTGIVDRLVEQSLVSRNPGLEDRRVIWIEATDKGRQLLADLVETHTGNMIQILNYMSLEELEALSIGLSGYIRALEEHQKEFMS
jgi:DNA-binding MarR family transcriptional regulator